MAKKAKILTAQIPPETLVELETMPIKARTAAFCNDRIAAFQQLLASKPKSRGGKSAGPTDVIVQLAAYRLQQLNAFRELGKPADGEETTAKPKKRGSKSRDAAVPPPANNWVPIGPSVIRQAQVSNRTTTSGRVRGIAVSPDGMRVYVATANGGVWRSDDQGNSWVSLMDRYDENPQTGSPADTLACGAIAVHFNTRPEEDFIVVGSGEGTASLDRYFGIGPIISRDGGRNWQTEVAVPLNAGLSDLMGQGFFELAVHPQNPDMIVAATTNGLYRREPVAGNRWQWVLKGLGVAAAANSRATSVVVAEDPVTRAVTFYAAVRIPGGATVGVFSSPDGHTWTALGGALPTLAQRITLAVKRDTPGILYAFLQSGQIWRFSAGPPAVWLQVGGPNLPPLNAVIGTQGWYDLTIAVAPDNVNRIYLGGATRVADAAGALAAASPPGEEAAGSVWRFDLIVAAAVTVASADYIGGSVHADCHVLVFTPGNANKLWVGCDGGVYYSETPTGLGMIFTSKNHGLQTICVNSITNHPNHESTIFCGTQDNGGLRGTGEAAWLYSSPGDSGGFAVNWNNPMQVIAHYTNDVYRIGTDGAGRDPAYANYSAFRVPLGGVNNAYFYAPLVTTPASATAAEATRIAFGGAQFVHLNDNFGVLAAWNTIGGALANQVRSLCFQAYRKLYAGDAGGGVFRYDQNAGTGVWTVTQINNLGALLPQADPVTCIVPDPTDATGNSIYITFGGFTDYRHVWHFNGAVWTARSGPAAGNPAALLNVQFNSIAVDPRHPQILYAGADIGVWRSLDSGSTWHPFSQGLPDSPVMDLKIFRDAARNMTLLRAGLHGRGVFERDVELDPAPGVIVAAVPRVAGVQLYVRSTQTDTGRYPLNEALLDPTNPAGVAVSRFNSPDIRVDTPDPANGRLRQRKNLDFVEFTDRLIDQSSAVATHASAHIVNRVHVQIHNRGILTADNIDVTLIIAPAPGALPNPNVPLLPADYATSLNGSNPIGNNDWRTVGTVKLHAVRTGFPRIAGFDLASDLIRQVAVPGNNQYALLALVHHSDDAFPTAGATDPNTLVRGERRAAMKLIQTTAFAGVVAGAPATLATLAGYVAVPAGATAAGAPLDAILLKAMRQNDILFAQRIENLAATPQAFAYTEGTVTNPSTDRWLSADQIRLEISATMQPGTPLCWNAKEKIYLNALLDATGTGAAAGAAGDFGGTGGAAGAGANGGACLVPGSGKEVLAAATGTANGTAADAIWSSRAMLNPAACKGGSGGGGATGGRGGGVICICAPVIEFGPNARLQANGATPTTGNSGGGGGGVIILMANEFINVNEAVGHAQRNVFADGGVKAGTAGDGGIGVILKKIIL